MHPEEIEAVINRHPAVQMSRVKSRRSPITGSIVVADIILAANGRHREKEIRDEILSECRDCLVSYKVPAVISFVQMLDVTPAGKRACAGELDKQLMRSIICLAFDGVQDSCHISLRQHLRM